MPQQLRVEIIGDASQYQRTLDSATKSTTSSAKQWAKSAAVFGGVGLAVAGVTEVLHAGISEWEESAKVAAQTNAVLRSTRSAANVTAKEIDKLATSIMKKSGIDDEAIKSGENLLLTFTNIRNETGKGNKIFNQATQAITDMSVALGQDLKSSAIQVGKALNDPVKGITALRRVGVSFTSQQQQLIKDLVNGRKAVDNFAQVFTGKLSPAQAESIVKLSKAGEGWREIADTLNLKVNPAQAKTMDFFEQGGHTLEAQKLILQELNKEFGGSAEAMGKTLPGQLKILREEFNNLAGQGVEIAIQKLEEMRPTIETIIGVIQSLMVVLRPIAKLIFDNLVTPMKVVSDLIRGDFSQAWEDLKAPIIDVRNILVGFWSLVQAPFNAFVTGVIGGFQRIFDWARDKTADIAGFFTAIPDKIGNFGGALRDKIAGFVNAAGIGAFLQDKVADFAHFFASLPGDIADALVGGAKAAAGRLKGWFSDLFGWLPGWAKKILDIHSPSGVFEDIGGHIVGGLIEGLGSMAGALQDKVEQVIGAPIDWAKKKFAAGWEWMQDISDDVFSFIGDLFTGGVSGTTTGYIELPEFPSTDHETLGLAGYRARDIFAPGGTIVGAPADGTVTRQSGRPFDEGWSNGPGSAIGLSLYIAGRAADYFLTHFDRLFVGVGARIRRGTPIGTVGPMDRYGVPAHIHEGYRRFALGGIVTRPTLGLVGEAGPEAIIPLKKVRGGMNVTVHVHGDVLTEGQLVEKIHAGLLRKNRRNPTLGFT